MFTYKNQSIKHISAFALCAIAGQVFAEDDHDHEHRDVSLLLSGTQVIGANYNDEEGVHNLGLQIIEGEFGEFFTADQPGFNSIESGATLPSGTSFLPGNTSINMSGVSFTINNQSSNLFFWDGSGDVDFNPVADGISLNINSGSALIPQLSMDLDGSDTDVGPILLAETSDTGFLHKHANFNLLSDGDTPSSGFYAWAIQFDLGTQVSTSDPIFMIFGAGDHDEAQHEEAVAYFESTNIVPEPAAAAGLLAGFSLLATRRRRQA